MKTRKTEHYRLVSAKSQAKEIVRVTLGTSSWGLQRNQPLRGSETQKDIFKTHINDSLYGLVQQTVQIVARFAHTI